VWEVESGRALAVWTGHTQAVSSCAWSPDGKRALSAGYDNTMRLWDAASGEQLAVWRGYSSWVNMCVWSAQTGKILVAGGGAAGTLEVRDGASGALELVIATTADDHVSIDPRPTPARILAASKHAWRTFCWQVRHDGGRVDVVPAETFGLLPPAELER
jgi:WD40 repeat protein